MFSFIKNSLQKIYSTFSSALSTLLGRTHLDDQTAKELEILLLSADTGLSTTRLILEELKKTPDSDESLKVRLRPILLSILDKPTRTTTTPTVYLLVGINGSGKTTVTGKLAHQLHQQNKKVLLAAADTFRAAAPEQLQIWAERTGAQILIGKEGQDPASLVFNACEQFKQQQFDALIIDTAGRLQTKTNLMHELTKIKRVVSKQLPDHQIHTLLTIDSMLGQNSFEQAKLFKEATQVDGIVLTKMDGTGKGGIVFAIAKELMIPVEYISYGEQVDQIKLFNTKEYVDELLQI